MDIGGVATPVASDTSRPQQRSGDAVSAAVKEGTMPENESAENASHVANNVVEESSEIPADKLPPHLGRNINVTA